MTIKMGQRDKIFLVGGVIFLTCYLLFLFVAQPAYENQANINRRIKDKINFIEKYYKVINQTSYYQAKEVENKNIKSILQKKFLAEKEPGLAAAALQKLLQGFS